MSVTLQPSCDVISCEQKRSPDASAGIGGASLEKGHAPACGEPPPAGLLNLAKVELFMIIRSRAASKTATRSLLNSRWVGTTYGELYGCNGVHSERVPQHHSVTSSLSAS